MSDFIESILCFPFSYLKKLGVLEGQSHLNCQKSIKTSKKNLLPGMETKTEVWSLK